MKKTILTVGAVGLAVAGSAQTAKADETDLHTNEVNEQQVQAQAQTTKQKEETAKSELDDAKNNEQQAQTKADTAQSYAVKADKNAENAKNDVNKAQTDADKAKPDLDKAQGNLNNATQDNVNKAQTDVDNAKTDVDNKQSTADKLHDNLDSAHDNVNSKTDDVNKAQNAVNSAKNDVNKAQTNNTNAHNAVKGLDKARNDVDNAQNAVNSQKNNVAAAQKKYDDAVSQVKDFFEKRVQPVKENYNRAEAALKQAKADFENAKSALENTGLDKAQKAYDIAKTNLENAQKTYNQAKDEYDSAQNELVTLNKALETARLNHEQAQKDLSSLQTAYNKALSDYEAAQKAYNTAKEKENSAQKKADDLAGAKLLVSETTKQKAKKMLEVFDKWEKAGRPLNDQGYNEEWENAYMDFLRSLHDNEKNLNVKNDELIFTGNEDDKNVSVDPSHLTREQQKEISQYACWIINSLRDDLGLTPYVGKVTVTEGMLDMLNVVNGNKNNAHSFGVDVAYDSASCESVFNMYDLKMAVKVAIWRFVTNDLDRNITGHAMSITGIDNLDAHGKCSETYLGVTTRYGKKSDIGYSENNQYTGNMWDFYLVSNLRSKTTNEFIPAQWYSDGKTAADHEKIFTEKGGFSKIDNPYESVTSELANAKKQTQSAEASLATAEKTKNLAESVLNAQKNKVQSTLNDVNSAQAKVDQAKKLVLERNQSWHDATVARDNAQSDFDQAERALSFYIADKQRKQENYDKARIAYNKAQKNYNSAKRECDGALSDLAIFERQFAEVRTLLDTQKAELAKNEKALADAQTELENAGKAYQKAKAAVLANQNTRMTTDEKDTLIMAQNQLAQAQKKLYEAQKTLVEKQKALESAKEDLAQSETEYANAKIALETAQKELEVREQVLENLKNAPEIYEKAKADYDNAVKALEQAKEKLAQAEAEKTAKHESLDKAKAELEQAKAQTALKQKAYDTLKAQLELENAVKKEQAKLNDKTSHTDTTPLVLKKSGNSKTENGVAGVSFATGRKDTVKSNDLPQMGEKDSDAATAGVIMTMFAGILAMLGLSDRRKA